MVMELGEEAEQVDLGVMLLQRVVVQETGVLAFILLSPDQIQHMLGAEVEA